MKTVTFGGQPVTRVTLNCGNDISNLLMKVNTPTHKFLFSCDYLSEKCEVNSMSMNSKGYPVLSKEFSISKVITEKGDSMLLYNTVTRMKARPNEATFEFAERCRGNKSLEEIISDLSRMSGESPEKIQEDLSPLIKKMVDNKIIYFVPSPLHPPRPEPYKATLWERLPNVELEITRQCNLRCKHCYSNSGIKRDDELTSEEIKKLIDELAHIGVLNIVLTGGEPLLHPHLFDIIEYIRSKPMSCIVFTNGTLVTKEIVHKFKELGIISVAISIDGATAETHDTFRGVESFEKVVQAIIMLKEAGIPIRANISAYKGILTEIVDLMRLLRKWRITERAIHPITFTGRPERSGFMITPEEYKEILNQVKEYEVSVGEAQKQLPYVPGLLNCGIGLGNLFIRSNGDVAPCPTFPGEISLGNIRETTIAEIWNNSAFLNKVRCMNASENDICRECPHIRVCGGGCLADIYRRTGELKYGDPYECAYFQVYNDYIPVKYDKKYLSVEIR